MISDMKHHAFSLLELLCCLAIIGIISAAAYPSYQHHMRNSQRMHTQTQLLQLAHSLEKQFAHQHRYQPRRLNTNNTHYSIHVAITKNHYELIATPKGAQRLDDCGELRLLQSGKQLAQKANCWI